MSMRMTAAFCLILAAVMAAGCSRTEQRDATKQEQPVVKGITLVEVSSSAIPG